MRTALRLSLQYGAGDLHWFERLGHDDQVTMLAYERYLADPEGKPAPNPLLAAAERLRKKAR